MRDIFKIGLNRTYKRYKPYKSYSLEIAIMNVNLRVIFCLLILLIVSRAALSQASNVAGSGAVSGVVKLGDAPAAGITLALLPEGMWPVGQQPDITNRAVTDEKGEYRFTNVAAGRFR